MGDADQRPTVVAPTHASGVLHSAPWDDKQAELLRSGGPSFCALLALVQYCSVSRHFFGEAGRLESADTYQKRRFCTDGSYLIETTDGITES